MAYEVRLMLVSRERRQKNRTRTQKKELNGESNLEIPFDSFKESLNCVAIIENYESIVTTLIKKLLSIIVEIPFSLSNSVPGSCSAFMFQFCPNHRGTQSRASNSLSYVIGRKLLSFFLTTTMKK